LFNHFNFDNVSSGSTTGNPVVEPLDGLWAGWVVVWLPDEPLLKILFGRVMVCGVTVCRML